MGCPMDFPFKDSDLQMRKEIQKEIKGGSLSLLKEQAIASSGIGIIHFICCVSRGILAFIYF